VTNALPHIGQEVVVKLDIREFFPSIRAARIEQYFRKIGWNAEAALLLTKLCTHEGALPQGAPTSPRLSNLVNFKMDARLAGLAKSRRASYTRYADDMTFSFSRHEVMTKVGPLPHDRFNDVISAVKVIAELEGYQLHTKKKLRIARRHDRQIVTGLVVNEKVNLPRATRRRLRAIEHNLRAGKPTSISEAQLAGWKALRSMIATQSVAKR